MDRKELGASLRQVGLKSGDTVFVHSSLKALGPVEGRADAVLDAFLDVLRPDGHLIVPTHSWATVNDLQPVFHQTHTPSTVGVLTNKVRLMSGTFRSLHPTHSVAALGPRAEIFCAGHELDDTPCSPRSPYARLCDWNGKVVLLGVDLRRCTLFHCFEEMAGEAATLGIEPQIRYLIRADGSELQIHYRGHWGHTSDHYDRVEGALLAEGIMTKTPLGQGEIRVLDARKAKNYLVPLLQKDPRFFA